MTDDSAPPARAATRRRSTPAQEAIPKTVGEAYAALAPITEGAFGGI